MTNHYRSKEKIHPEGKMDYNEFKNYLTEHVREYLPEEYQNKKIEIFTVEKVNRKLESFRFEGGPSKNDIEVSPTLYFEDLYEKYLKTDVYAVMNYVAESYELTCCEDLDVSFFNREWKDNIVFCLVNTAQNADFLAGRPHRECHDLSIRYRVIKTIEGGMIVSTVVTNEIMEDLNLKEEDLYSLAVNNTKHLLPPKIVSMEFMIKNIMGDKGLDECAFDEALDNLNKNGFHYAKPESDIWIITNSCGVNGAASILYEENLYNLAELIGKDLYILPSSIHEVIAVPVKDDIDADGLARIVYEANHEAVDEGDRLSNQVYYYSMSDHILRMATNVAKPLCDTIKN